MKKKFVEKFQIPSGVQCTIEEKVLKCKKGARELSRSVDIFGVDTKVEGSEIVFECKAGNKRDFKTLKSYIAHLQNIFRGLENNFVYKMEICNVHFPMTVKVDGNKFVISNFLGEKTSRVAKILPGVEIKVQPPIIIISSPDCELAGQTAANIEKVTKIAKRDRRVFQDGIYITEKPGRAGESEKK